MLVLIFLLSLVFLGMEIYFRFYFNSTDSFSISKVSEKWYGNNWATNNWGFRDNMDYKLNIEQAKKRISFLGDSFTAGHGVAIDETFFMKIRKDNPAIEIHSLAQPGYDTPDEISMLNDLLRKGYVPDTIVLIYNLNDIVPYMSKWRQPAHLQTGTDKQGFLVNHSYFVNFLYWRYRVKSNPGLSNYYSVVGKLYNSTEWTHQKKDLLTLKNTVESHGGSLMAVTFPFLHFNPKDYPYKGIHQNIEQFWINQNVPHLDLFEAFQKENTMRIVVNKFDRHPNAIAHAIASKEIEKFIFSN